MGSPSVLGAGRESHRPDSHRPDSQPPNAWRRFGLCAAIAWGFAGSYWGALLAVEPAIFAYRECMSTQPADPSACHAKLYRDWSHYSGNRLSYAVLVGLAPIPIVLLVAFGLTRRRDRKHSSRQGAPGIRSTQLQPRQTPVTSGSARHPL